MPDIPAITLPDDLVPTDGRFGSGPSKVDTDALAALAATGTGYMGTSHRQATVRSVVGRVRSGLTALYRLPDGYEVVLGVGGATAFWDCAAFGLIERRSQHLVFGEFSAKFAAVTKAAPHLDDPETISSEPGTHPHPVPSEVVDAYAFTHNETSTGVTMPIIRPGSDGLVLVDATSAAGAIAVDPTQFDVYYFSPQKAFGSDGGLWVALCSPAAVKRISRIGSSVRWIPAFLSLTLAVDNSRKDQTYNTPALATLFLLAHQIDRMLERGGLEWAIDRSRRSSATIYQWAEARDFASPFVTDPGMRSPTVVTIDLDPSISADTVEAVLRANGVLDTFGYRKLGRNQLRISCFPNVEPDDVATLTAAIDHIVAKL
ncbi:MAG: phosphoserine transaminase [Acidimicrobiia bacterium]